MKKINKYILGHLENPKFSIWERLHINKDIDSHNQHPKTRDGLIELINELIEERGNDANLNDIDTSKITDMNSLFDRSEFNGDISKWNVSNVYDMSYMFMLSKFNGDISNWDVSNVETMDSMFYRSEFTGENGDISKWDVSNAKNNMYYMFSKSPLEKNPPKWYK